MTALLLALALAASPRCAEEVARAEARVASEMFPAMVEGAKKDNERERAARAAKEDLRQEARDVVARNRAALEEASREAARETDRALGLDVALARAERAARELSRLERLEAAAHRLDEADAASAAATTPQERRGAWRSWFEARTDLRAAAREPETHRRSTR